MTGVVDFDAEVTIDDDVGVRLDTVATVEV